MQEFGKEVPALVLRASPQIPRNKPAAVPIFITMLLFNFSEESTVIDVLGRESADHPLHGGQACVNFVPSMSQSMATLTQPHPPKCGFLLRSFERGLWRDFHRPAHPLVLMARRRSPPEVCRDSTALVATDPSSSWMFSRVCVTEADQVPISVFSSSLNGGGGAGASTSSAARSKRMWKSRRSQGKGLSAERLEVVRSIVPPSPPRKELLITK